MRHDQPVDDGPADDASPTPTEGQQEAAEEMDRPPERRAIDPEKARETDLSPSVVFGILADERQRYVLYYLTEQGGKAMHEDIAEQVAAWENRTTAELSTAEMSNRVVAGLYHADLPKLEDYDLIEYDEEIGTVTLTEQGKQLDTYLEFAKQTENNDYLDATERADERGHR